MRRPVVFGEVLFDFFPDGSRSMLRIDLDTVGIRFDAALAFSSRWATRVVPGIGTMSGLSFLAVSD